MRRALALVGFTALCTQWAGAFLPSAAFLPLAAVLVLLGIGAPHWPRLKRWNSYIIAICITAGAMLGIRAGYFTFVLEPVRALSGQSCTITATVRTASEGYSPESIDATAHVTHLDGNPVRPFLLRIDQLPAMDEGDQFCGQVEFSELPRNRYQSWSYAQGIYLRGTLVKDAPFAVKGQSAALTDAMLRLRAQLSASLQRVLTGDLGGVAAAMTVADERNLSEQDEELFRRAGLSHVLVVSGLHLSALSGLVYSMTHRLWGRKIAALCAMGATAFLVLLLGFSASVTRAGVSMLALYGGMLAGRRSDALTSLGLAALCLCTINPFAAVDVGLLLSFSATLGVLAGNAVYGWLHQFVKAHSGVGWRAVKVVLQTVLISLGASLATLPVLIASGLGISLVSLAGNLLCVPVMSAAVFLGLIAAVAGLVPWLEPVARLAGVGCGLSIRWMEAVSRFLSALPGAYVYLWGAYAVGVCLLVYLLVYLAVRLHVHWWKCVLCNVAFLAAAIGFYTVLDSTVLHLYPAGSAENAPVVLTQRDCTVVIFRGSDQNAEDVLQTLQEHGRSQVDLLLDLRSDSDVALLAEKIPARQVASAQMYTFNGRFVPAQGLTITLRRQAEGTLACLEFGGYKIGVSTGKLDFTAYPPFDVYFGGSGTLGNLDTRALILSRKGRAWTNEVQAEQYPGGVRQVLVSAGGGVKIDEESYDFT